VKKILLAALVLSSVEFLSLSFFTNEIFARTAQPISPGLNTGAHGDAGAAKIDLPVTTAVGFVTAMYGELTPRSTGFLSANENAGIVPRNVVVVRYFFTTIFAPKVSRYIANSVLII